MSVLGAGAEGAQPAARPARRTPRPPSPARRYVAEPVGHRVQRGLESRQCPAFAPRTMSALDAELGEHPRRDRHVGGVLRARRERRAAPPARAPARGSPGAVSPSRRPRARSSTRRRALGRATRRRRAASPGLLDLLGQPGRSARGHPGRRAPPRGGQQVAREDEQRAPHRELLDQRRGRRTAPGRRRRRSARRPGPAARGRRWRARSSAAPSSPGSRPRRRPRGAPGAIACRRRQPGAALGVGDVPHDASRLAPSRRWTAASTAPPVLVGLVLLSLNLRPAAVSVGPVLDRGPRRPGHVGRGRRPADLAAGDRVRGLRCARAGRGPPDRAAPGHPARPARRRRRACSAGRSSATRRRSSPSRCSRSAGWRWPTC